MKTCTKCGIEKSFTEFAGSHRNRSGLQARCKQCWGEASKKWRKENPEKARASVKAWELSNPEKVKAKSIARRGKRQPGYYIRRFGITTSQYDGLLLAQSGMCAICQRSEKTGRRLSVDHIHGSNPTIIRGLLCLDCNTSLGKFNDNPALLRRAAEYLEKQTKNNK